MLTYLPKPYDDELFSSIVARYVAHFGGHSGPHFAEQLFGKKLVWMQADLPTTIGYFADNSFNLWGLTAEEIIRKFTLFPFYTYFADEMRAKMALELLISAKGRNVNHMLGLAASRVVIPEYLRFCPQCSSEDFERNDETYWRRAHQIPGVLLCTTHKEMLCDSDARYRSWGQNHFADASNAVQISKPPKLVLSGRERDLALRIAGVCEDALAGKDNKWGRENVRALYREAARNAGYPGGVHRIDQRKLGNDFIEFFGDSFLKMLGCELHFGKSTNWLKEIFSENGRAHHPLHHILLQIFLKEPPELANRKHPFGSGPWKCPNQFADHGQEKTINAIRIYVGTAGLLMASAHCACGFSFSFKETSAKDPLLPIVTRVIKYGSSWERKAKELRSSGFSKLAIARALSVNPLTAEKLLHKKTTRDRRKVDTTKIPGWRKEWKALMKSVSDRSKGEARRLRPRLYSHLYMHDRDWLLSQSSRLRPGNKNRVNADWSARDQEYVEKLYTAVEEIKEHSPPKRVTPCGVLNHAGILGRITKGNRQKLPLTDALLRDSQESLEDFRERRIRYVAEKAINERLSITPAVLRARVNLDGIVLSERLIGLLNDLCSNKA